MEEAAVKSWIAAWTIGVALAVPANASAQDPQSVLTVRVRVDDYANVSGKDLAKAEAQATAAYRAAGFEVVWSPSESRPDAGPAATAARSIEIRVVILPRDMAEKKCREEALGAGVMGVAISTATEARNRLAYIFYDRIERVTISNHIPIERGLGHALAHEIGHLLIGLDSHSDHGLMRPEWNPQERQVQTLTSRQVQTIRSRFKATVSN
jgi:hypothetical protein